MNKNSLDVFCLKFMMRNYKNFKVWLISHELVLKIYREILPGFPESEKYGLSSQIRRAAYSIPLNIVEGCGRSSEKEFAHFLDFTGFQSGARILPSAGQRFVFHK